MLHSEQRARLVLLSATLVQEHVLPHVCSFLSLTHWALNIVVVQWKLRIMTKMDV